MTVPARRPEDDALDRLAQAVEEAEGAAFDAGEKDAKEVYESRMADLATVREALERQREEVDAASRETDYQVRQANQILVRALAAEAEVRRLTEGLRYLDELAQAWIAADTYDGLGHVERRRVAHARAKMVGDKARAPSVCQPFGRGRGEVSGDRLAQIEAAVEITLRRARDSAGSQPEFVVAPNSVSCADVLALVEIAKAARAAEKYVICVTDPACGDCDACRFHAALARLDSGAAEGDA